MKHFGKVNYIIFMDYLIGSSALNLLVLFYLSVLSVVFSNTLVFSLDVMLFVLSFFVALNFAQKELYFV